MAVGLLFFCVVLISPIGHSAFVQLCTMLCATSMVDGDPQSLALLFWGPGLKNLGTPAVHHHTNPSAAHAAPQTS